eukprot:GHVH01004479.1.p1 GENE.GHVH01004479.1~~GHVH01004479.1.p1  ORF type:complete len:282 (+),score=22.84 GHVH01004479.1:115-960(+)
MNKPSIQRRAVAATCASLVSGLVSSPFSCVNVSMRAANQRTGRGSQLKILKGVLKGIDIVHKHGVRHLWVGMIPTALLKTPSLLIHTAIEDKLNGQSYLPGSNECLAQAVRVSIAATIGGSLITFPFNRLILLKKLNGDFSLPRDLRDLRFWYRYFYISVALSVCENVVYDTIMMKLAHDNKICLWIREHTPAKGLNYTHLYSTLIATIGCTVVVYPLSTVYLILVKGDEGSKVDFLRSVKQILMSKGLANAYTGYAMFLVKCIPQTCLSQYVHDRFLGRL